MIKVRNLWKRYGKNDILKGLTLDVHRGETLVIMGRSGVGKSVLLRQLIGIEKPDQGTIDIDNVSITNLNKVNLYSAVKNMGMLFQGAALFDSMDLEENVAFCLKQHGDPATNRPFEPNEIRKRVLAALDMVGLSGSEKKMPSQLSGGMRKRAGLARLIVYRPEILLYDEPTTGLDPITAQQINELIVQTQKELKATSIVVTHDIASALFVADRLALHQDGQITHVNEPSQFLQIDDPTIHFLKNSMTINLRKK